MSRRARVLVGGLSLLVLVYIIQFTLWWWGSPRTTRVQAGRTIRRVEFHYTPFYWHTIYLWMPARFVIEEILGYRSVGVAPADAESIEIYEHP